jgi:atypical dual specificity phosphatase
MNITWIEPNSLAASPLPYSADDARSLYVQGIRAILTLTERPLTVQKGITDELLNELMVTPFHIPIDDYQAPSLKQVIKALRFIDAMQAQSKPVLVHCLAGQGRTGTILHAYYLNKGLSLMDAQKQVAEKRPICVFKDLSYEQQVFLHEYAANGRTVHL